MKKIQENIDKQLDFNKGRNLFYNGLTDSLKFIPETLHAIEHVGEMDVDSENLLIDYVTNRVLQEFCRVNQYYSFDKQAREDLRDLYAELFFNLKSNKTSIDSISRAIMRI